MTLLRFLILFFFVIGHASLLHAKKLPTKKDSLVKKEAVLDAAALEKDVTRFPGTSSVLIHAKQAILLDYNSGKVLFEKNADERMVPSSLTKMMTSYIIEEKLQNKELTMDSAFVVNEEAWRTQGSKTFVQLGSMIKISDLLRGIIIQSGNDACIVAAHGIAGGEKQFAALMNAKAKALGLNNSHFKNSHGLPEEGHYSTARDMAKLGAAIIKDHKEFYDIYQEKYFTHNGITQGNRNPLLYGTGVNSAKMGCDGIKTGHTDAGGFGAVLSCVDGAQRYILAVNGLPSMQARADESRRLMAWATENFEGRVILKKGDIIEPATKVKFGLKPTIRLALREDVTMLALRSSPKTVTKRVELNATITAPIKEGDTLGKVFVNANGTEHEAILVSLDASEKMGLFKQALSYLGL